MVPVRFAKPSSGEPSTSNSDFHGGFPDSWPWSHIITPNSDGSTELARESVYPPAIPSVCEGGGGGGGGGVGQWGAGGQRV